MNLVSNSLKFTSIGGITIEVKVERFLKINYLKR